MTECLKNAASDAVTRRTGTVKAVIETVFRRHQLACTVRVTEEGGVVDRFGLRAEPGVAFEAVAALAPELARELGVAAVRVTEYAIDRTFAGWGIEVPHPPAARQYKTWRELTESECLESTGALEVTLLLGATVLGEPVAVDPGFGRARGARALGDRGAHLGRPGTLSQSRGRFGECR